MSNQRELFTVSRTLLGNLRGELQNLLGIFSSNDSKIKASADLLIAKYSEEHRFYHNLSHIHYLLFHAESFEDKFVDYDEVRLAIWFHDAIYDPKSRLNEIESARLAVEKLTELNFPPSKIEKVEKMVLATQKHDASGLDEDGKLFLDLDLGILGAAPQEYKKYAKAIRQEYAFAPESEYRYKRQLVLESFLKNKYIYYTDEMRAAFEKAARDNIANEIKELS